MDTDFPDDADGDALRRLVRSGNDLSKPMIIDFYGYAPDEEIAQAAADLATTMGFDTHWKASDEDATLSVYCSSSMLAEHASLVRAQAELNDAWQPLGMACDGWGTFGNRPDPARS